MISSSVEHRNSLLLLIITAILWSAGGFLIKLIDWNSFAIAGGRSFFAAIVLWVYLRKPNFTWSADQIGASVAYALCCGLFVMATKLTTAANAIILQYTGPIYVALLSGWLLNEKITKLDWFTIIVVLCGMCLFFADSLSTDGLTGNIIAILSGISFAFLALFLRKQKHGSPTESLLLGNVIIVICSLPWIFGESSLIADTNGNAIETIPYLNGLQVNGLLWLLVLGVVQLGTPYILYGKAIRHVSALEATLVPVLEPLLNPLWVLLIMQEKPSYLSIIGGIIVLMAMIVRGIIRARH